MCTAALLGPGHFCLLDSHPDGENMGLDRGAGRRASFQHCPVGALGPAGGELRSFSPSSDQSGMGSNPGSDPYRL